MAEQGVVPTSVSMWLKFVPLATALCRPSLVGKAKGLAPRTQ